MSKNIYHVFSVTVGVKMNQSNIRISGKCLFKLSKIILCLMIQVKIRYTIDYLKIIVIIIKGC